MIEGLKVSVNGSELAELCRARALHHSDRAAKYTMQIVSMKNDQIVGMQYTNGDPVQALEDRRVRHEGEAAEMEFIASHLVSSETYILGLDDLVKLGIVRSRY